MEVAVRGMDQWSDKTDDSMVRGLIFVLNSHFFFFLVEFLFTRVPQPGNNDGTSGTIEVIYQNEWGSVCDAGFGQEEATVACRQFGFQYV